MVRTELIELLAADYPELLARDIEKIVLTFFDEFTKRLADGGRVEIRGFGSFATRARNAHTGRNPRSGEAVEVKAKRVPRFKPSVELQRMINIKNAS